ncbi:MAG: aldo/keto reductase [Defluviitaleaceae bacterium]|nr:aldo/keto reductase [Defluviitaleaceae bacterium]MCL2835982.1 aldo/keto reductase [Defluviitaleaceae bacterium]
MKYRENPKNSDSISALSFGYMRINKNDAKNEEMLRFAVEQGVNYIDTAYIYPGNEATLGRLLERTGLRDKVKIATKLPTYLVGKPADAERIFNVSLERLRTGFVDYYMIHMLTGVNDWERLKSLGILEWIVEKKKSGKIKNFGFSYHGGTDAFVALIDAFDWDFCMIQYNYVDEHTQAGRRGLEYAAGKGVPVVIMEPLRGGTLANVKRLPSGVMDIFNKYPVKRHPAEWALRWLWNQPGILTVLSGMKDMQNLRDNIRAAEESEPGMLNEKEFEVYNRVIDVFRKQTSVPCTSCGYCMPCPRGVDIPQCFDLYNQRALGSYQALGFYIIRTHGTNASLCSDCGKCEPLCPQGIEVRKELRGVRKRMEGFWYRPIRFAAKKFMKR